MSQELTGAPVAQAVMEGLRPRIAALARDGVSPKLAIVRVGERSGDLSYERGACKRCSSLGIEVEKIVLPGDTPQIQLEHAIECVSGDGSVHGCLLLRPLPRTLDERRVAFLLSVEKDVDCLTDGSLAGVFAGRPAGFPPCTSEAVVLMLEHYGCGLRGADVVVVGRSLVIGRPVAMMLQARNATVTMCHTKTHGLAEKCRAADVLVVAAGHARIVGADFVRDGQTVIDVGINWDEVTGKLCGDVDYDTVAPIVSAISPVPRGVGSVTTAVLAKHVIEAAERSCT